MVQPHRPQLTIQYGAEKLRFACRITKARTQTHSFSTSSFSVAVVVTRTRLDVTFYVRTLPVVSNALEGHGRKRCGNRL